MDIYPIWHDVGELPVTTRSLENLRGWGFAALLHLRGAHSKRQAISEVPAHILYVKKRSRGVHNKSTIHDLQPEPKRS